MTPDDRTRQPFVDELDSLQERALEMAGIVEMLVGRAARAVLDRDATVEDRIREDDRRVDALEMAIDEQVVEMLALYQPMAGDLRLILTVLKLANDLERVGDHASNMARAARRLADAPPLPEIRELAEMAEVTQEMLSDALASFVGRNSGTARMVCQTDDRVDDLRSSMYRILLTHMLEDPRRITGALELLLVSQNLERIADLATNISEDVVFLVEGRSIKHHAEDAAAGSG